MKLEDLQYPTGTNALKKYEAEKKYLENKLKKFENVLDNDWKFGKHKRENQRNNRRNEKRQKAKNKKQMLVVWRRWKVIKIFLNLEKRRGIQDEIRKLRVNNQEHQKKIQNELLFFYQPLFRNMTGNTSRRLQTFSEWCFCSETKIWNCEGDLSELELLKINAKQ